MYQTVRWLTLIAIIAGAAACGGGGGSSSPAVTPTPSSNPAPAPAPDPVPDPTPAPDTVMTNAQASRLLTQATFGPRSQEVASATVMSRSDWLQAEIAKPASLYMPLIQASPIEFRAASLMFWRNAVQADDQLRQRMVYALSQILVVSDSGDILSLVPAAVGYYQDLLNEHAFGNYRDLLQAITYSPAMGHYLTYLGNEKANPVTGQMPDENYARELLQLFTIGVVQLNMDGTPVLDESGEPIEIYDNTDITGLARVFTGLDFSGPAFNRFTDEFIEAPWIEPMAVYPARHSALEKSFLGLTIAENTGAEQSITMALDHIFNHPNVAPFVSRQLIQRFVTSNPAPAYVQRVASAFEAGMYTLPDGDVVGEGQRGDLQATVAAVLMDDAAVNVTGDGFGKIREPAIRFVHWARAFGVTNPSPEYAFPLRFTASSESLAQHPFGSPSVFNFYRPGYVAPGTLSGAAGMTVPELQIVNATSIAGYPNFMVFFIADQLRNPAIQQAQADRFAEENIPFDAVVASTSFMPDYSAELILADDAEALVTHLDELLTYSSMSDASRNLIVETISLIPVADDESRRTRVHIAIWMVMTSADYLLQR